jgi:exopolysaccharide production protein ExoQ
MMAVDRIALLFRILGVALPMLGLFAPLGVAPLGMVVGLTLIGPALRQRAWRGLPWALVLLLGAFALWMTISALWAIDARDALGGAAKFAATALVGLMAVAVSGRLGAVATRPLLVPLAVSVVAGVAIIAAEALTGLGISHALAMLKGHPVMGVSGIKRGATILALLVWPLGLLLVGAGRPRLGVAVAVLGILVLAGGDSSSSRMALAVALVAAAAAALSARLGRLVLTGLVLVAVVGMPLLARSLPSPAETYQNWTWVPNSAHHRLTIWTFTGARIAEKPVLGWGMEASRSMPGGEDEIRVTRTAADGRKLDSLLEQMLPLHPHNGILQVWLELGGIGAMLAAAILIRIGHCTCADRLNRWQRAAAAGTFATAFMVSAISYSLWQSWWQSSLWLTVAILAAAVSRDKKRES